MGLMGTTNSRISGFLLPFLRRPSFWEHLANYKEDCCLLLWQNRRPLAASPIHLIPAVRMNVYIYTITIALLAFACQIVACMASVYSTSTNYICTEFNRRHSLQGCRDSNVEQGEWHCKRFLEKS